MYTIVDKSKNLCYTALKCYTSLPIGVLHVKSIGGFSMFFFNSSAYDRLLGNIDKLMLSNAVTCVSQCTGCMCNCRCSCSGGYVSDFEWEVM